MDVYRYRPGDRMGENCVVVLGFFDGLHLGHRRLIAAAADIARKTARALCVFTFESENTRLKKGSPRIYPTAVKLSLLARMGVDRTIIADFDAVADMDAPTFVQDVLLRDLDCGVAVCGYNFRFAKDARADAQTLVTLLLEKGRMCHVEPPYCLDRHRLSTTLVRSYIETGDMPNAARALSVPYHMVGVGERGLGLGSQLGTPTVNLPMHESFCQPKTGVYACKALVRGRLYDALTNIGSCPTFGARPIHAECWILDFEGDLHGETVEIYFYKFLREERSFFAAEELKKQIIIDKKAVCDIKPMADQWFSDGGTYDKTMDKIDSNGEC